MLTSLQDRVRTWLRGTRPDPITVEALAQEDKERVENIRTICLFLGPYRNLTTLTASVLYLHPHSQVLNHAGKRILSEPRLNFLADPSRETLERFCHYAILTSLGGGRGKRGGSLTLSHAFADHELMQRTYRARYGDTLLKPDIENLVWKDSLRIQNFIREQDEDVRSLSERIPELRFLMPVRNPMDCAVSNKAKGFASEFNGLRGESVEEILDAVVGEMAWVFRQKRACPERVFTFFEHELDEPHLIELARLLELDPERRWLDEALACCNLKPSYDHAPELRKRYRESVERHFEELPELIDPFLALAER